ncbi:hypothetical protein [Thermostaphylospora chromogena]|uniref:Uncharacterized protein n=1 Tax=Thermostaphylospora chromogena TaxID=35622 RepID=A0A1H0XKC2_9ACTN|nr:hypothetical protein [Thermostaphylospora chromogena]SDQ03357.1 hypothetical protein SAMN04489764_0048 [Thermostaphylospora chromogena]
MQTAIRRAGHMVEAVEASGLTDATFWSDQAVQVLSSFMHAADLYEGGTLATVYAWLVGTRLCRWRSSTRPCTPSLRPPR